MRKQIINTELFGTWAKPLSKIIDSQYFYDTLYSLDSEYTHAETESSYPIIYPDKIDMFRAFRACPYDDLKIVILGQEPYNDGIATGIAFANKLTLDLDPELIQIFNLLYGKDFYSELGESIANTDGIIHPDPTLIPLAAQGILFLNAALTVYESQPGSHFRVWNKFTIELLTELSIQKERIIYCLWGVIPAGFRSFINEKRNIILISESPREALQKGFPWKNQHFDIIKTVLKERKKEIIW